MKKVTLIITVIVLSTTMGTFIWLDNYYRFWTYLQTENFKALAEYDGSNVKGVQGRQILVHKEFIPYLEKINNVAIKNGVTVQVNSSYRLPDSNPDRTRHKQAANSNHFAGFAIDFNLILNGEKYFAYNLSKSNLSKQPLPVRKFIADIKKIKGLRWGGDFNDPIHIDAGLNKRNKKRYNEYVKSCKADYLNAPPKWKFWK